MSNSKTQNIILVSFIENQQNINDHIFSSHPIHIQQMCVSIRYLNGYSKSFPEKKTVYIYEGRVCDGKNYRNSNSGFSIGFFWGNGECIEHHHSMSSYAKKLLEVLLLHIDSSWWPWLFKNFVVVTAA